MKQAVFLLIIFLPGMFIQVHAQDQKVTEFGLTGGPVLFFPRVHHSGADLKSSMDNGWGWSLGIFVEDHRYLKIHPVVELNHYTVSTDVYFQDTSNGQNVNATNQQPDEGNFDNISFNHLAFSGGIKYFAIPELVLYPAVEIARTLNPFVEKNRHTLRLKLAAGVNLGVLDVLMEYTYGLYRQRLVFNEVVPYLNNHRDVFLQLKLQVPLYKIGKVPPDWKGDRYLK